MARIEKKENRTEMETQVWNVILSADQEFGRRTDLLNVEYGLNEISENDEQAMAAAQEVVESAEFVAEEAKITTEVYGNKAGDLILVAFEAAKAMDEKALKMAEKYLKLWAEETEAEDINDLFEALHADYANAVKEVAFRNQLAVEAAQDAEIIAVQEEKAAEEIAKANEAAKKVVAERKAKTKKNIQDVLGTVLESANLFLKVDNRKELEGVMHPAIKQMKRLAQSININPRDLLYKKIHEFLGSAEKYADEQDQKMMSRIFYLVRGLAGTVGLKDQAEKRIAGIQRRAKIAELNSIIANAKNAAKKCEETLMMAMIEEIKSLAKTLNRKVNREIREIEDAFPSQGLRIPASAISDSETLQVA